MNYEKKMLYEGKNNLVKILESTCLKTKYFKVNSTTI